MPYYHKEKYFSHRYANNQTSSTKYVICICQHVFKGVKPAAFSPPYSMQLLQALQAQAF